MRHISHEYDGIEYWQKFQKALCALFDWEARAYILLSEQSDRVMNSLGLA